MRWPTRGKTPTAVEPEATPGWRQPVVHRSPGFEAALAGLGGEAPCRVLDLGPAVAANFEFFARFARHISILDLPSTRAVVSGAEADDQEHSWDGSASVLPADRGPFDLVLVWDLVDYLEGDALSLLVDSLYTTCRREARLLLLVATGEELPWRPRVYEIVDEQHLIYHTVTPLSRPAPKLTPATIDRLFEGFQVDRSFVLRHGIQEYVAVRR
jgi:hypothetical protein